MMSGTKTVIEVLRKVIKRMHYPLEVMLVCVRWYAAYPLSFPCVLPCRRFADALTSAYARLGANVVRYSFIAADFHHLLLAGLPAHIHGYELDSSSLQRSSRITRSIPNTPPKITH
jgi:hypothetical protein